MINLNNIGFPKSLQFNINNVKPNITFSVSTNITITPIKNIITLKLFAPEVCIQIQTPTNKIFANAPYMYDLSMPKNQPSGLLTLKSMHNNINNEIFDGTLSIKNPLEIISQNITLKTLEKGIEKYCYPKEK